MSRKFSISLYLFIVFLLSWPFQIAHAFLGEGSRPILLISMIMVAVGTFISGKYIFQDGFSEAGWSWGRPKHYLLVFLFALLIWLVPTVIEQLTGLNRGYDNFSALNLLKEFLLSFCITLIPAFSEEFAWRGYLLPRLQRIYQTRKALLVHGLITWLWHVPVIVIMGFRMAGSWFVVVTALLLITLIPTVLHAIIFAYIWKSSGSLAVNTFYHTAFDEVRDSLQKIVGFGPLVEIWQMTIIVIFGVGFLYKGKWKNNRANYDKKIIA